LYPRQSRSWLTCVAARRTDRYRYGCYSKVQTLGQTIHHSGGQPDGPGPQFRGTIYSLRMDHRANSQRHPIAPKFTLPRSSTSVYESKTCTTSNIICDKRLGLGKLFTIGSTRDKMCKAGKFFPFSISWSTTRTKIAIPKSMQSTDIRL
jgi:hypothetical protein